MKRFVGISTLLGFAAYLIFFVFIYSNFDRNLSVKSAFRSSSGSSIINKYKAKELILLDFIEKKLLSPDGGIFTYIKKGKKDNETLSESVGLIMNYSILSGRKDLFDREFAYLTDNLVTDGNFIKWKVGEDTTCNSLIDDMRIIRALMDAYEKWGDNTYFNAAGFIQEAVYKSQVLNGGICELYDWKFRITKNVMPLCYLDLYSMEKVQVFNQGWFKIADNAMETVKSGLIHDGSPLFYKYFDHASETYTLDEEVKEGGGLCLTYTIYTALHLAEYNENTDFFTAWLRDEMRKGRLYAWYDPITLKPAQKIESTAVYALASIYADKVGDDKLARKFADKMLQFMISNKKSPYYGGFGDLRSGVFYSFDNLTALWALATIGEKNIS